MHSGFDKILRANQIKAVLGLYKISEFKKSNTALDNDNGVANEQDFPEERAFEVGLKSIVAHPQYKCREPDNDIGKQIFFFFFIIQANCHEASHNVSLGKILYESIRIYSYHLMKILDQIFHFLFTALNVLIFSHCMVNRDSSA